MGSIDDIKQRGRATSDVDDAGRARGLGVPITLNGLPRVFLEPADIRWDLVRGHIVPVFLGLHVQVPTYHQGHEFARPPLSR